MTARLWNATDAVFRALAGADFVRVTGRVEVYQDSLQLNLSTIRSVLSKEVVIEDFLPRTPRDVDEMFAKVRELAASVKNEHLSRLLRDFLDDSDFAARLKKAPAAVSYHQPYLGGLLEHTLAVATLADYVASRYPGLDREILITGTILHDIGKIEELSYTKAFEYTDRGRLIGHLIIAVQMVQDRVRRIEGFPSHLFDLLSHLILSHHGEYEWGSPKLPMTAEAIALHHLDNLDAKVEASTRTIEGDRLTEGNWTEYSRMFQRQLYRGPRSLPADEEAGT
jgi:3'-5' exoribonuclease